MTESQGSVPVSMLSGFLGAGKTTLLRHILQNSDMKIGCIVNDVASINIDAKLLRNDTRQRDPAQPVSTSDLTDTIELANGCACCSIADELFGSFENLLKIADRRGEPFDRIILENSGVAEPQNIRDQFNEAAALGHPLSSQVHLDTLVTVVDSFTFIQDYSSKAPLAARPELGEGGGMRPVVDLLVEQVECADFIVLNKADMLQPGMQDSLTAIVSSLNPLARVVNCDHGKVPVDDLFGPGAAGLVARLNVEGQHRGAVAAAKALEQQQDDTAVVAPSDVTKHGSDNHHHHHEHKDGEQCTVCENGDHNHKHKHNHKDGEQCTECDHDGHPSGNKPSRQTTTAAQRFGIVSFVYARRRPFHPQRLKDLVLRWMPVSHNKTLDEGEQAATGDSPIRTVLRSKGFLWISNSHSTAFYWSHAGQHFAIHDEGEWWAAVPDDEWPQAQTQRSTVLADFDREGKYGDRRQEIVFIGAGMDKDAIFAQLDSALLTDEEMDKYDLQYKEQQDPPHALV